MVIDPVLAPKQSMLTTSDSIVTSSGCKIETVSSEEHPFPSLTVNV